MSVLPGFVARNWRLKLAAFGLAVFLWAAVRAGPEGTPTRTITGVPVRVEVADLAWTTVGQPQPPSVDVRVGGPFGRFAPLDGDLSVHVPVEAVSSRDTVVELRRDWVRNSGSANLLVQDVNPTRVRISFEPTAEAAIPIQLRTTGSLPEGLALAQPLSVNPAVVRVRGRESRIEEVESIAMEPLDLSALTGSGTHRRPLDTLGFGDLSFLTTEASVAVRLEEAVERLFPGIPIRLDSLAEGVDTARVVTRPPTLQVTLRGGRTRVDQVSGDQLEAVIPSRVVRALRPGEQRLVPVRLRGVPELVEAFKAVDSVRVVRLNGSAGDSDTVGPGAEGAVPDTAVMADAAAGARAPFAVVGVRR